MRVYYVALHILFLGMKLKCIALLLFAICPRSSDLFYIVSYYIKSDIPSWTYSIYDKLYFQEVLFTPVTNKERVKQKSRQK